MFYDSMQRNNSGTHGMAGNKADRTLHIKEIPPHHLCLALILLEVY
jgi:hypothetical protein